MPHKTTLLTRRYVVALLLFWGCAAILLFLNGLRYGHPEIALIRNTYLPLLGGTVCIPLSLVLEKINTAKINIIIVVCIGMAAVGAALISFFLNPLTLSLLGAGPESFSVKALTNQLVVFFILLMTWQGLFYFQLSTPENTKEKREALPETIAHTFEFKDRDKLVKVQSDAVTAITANGDYATYHTESKQYLASERLQNLALNLESLGFKRIHRSVLVNRKHVKTVTDLGRGLFELSLTGSLKFKSSKTYIENVKQMVPVQH